MNNSSSNTDNPLVAFITLLFFFGLPWLITLIKKKRQVGKTWHYPLISTVIIKEKELKCAHCGHNQFSKSEGLLTTSWMSFFHIAYWNHSCTCFICAECKCMHWFHSPKEMTSSKKIDN